MVANTIEGLRKVQWGFEGVRAAGTLTLTTQPTAAETFVIGGITYTFRASGAVLNEINLGADVAATRLAVVAAINGTDGINVANPSASAAAFSGATSVITARQPGLASDSIVFTEALAGASNTMDGSGTLGGTTAGSNARGTDVPATSQLTIEELDWDDADENQYNPRYATGILARYRGAPVPVQHGTRFSFNDQPVPWEQLPHWLSAIMKGDVVPVWVPGSPGVWRWTFTRAPDTNPSLKSFVLERRFTDGAGNNVDQRCSYAMMAEWGVRYAENEHLRMSGNGFARRAQSEAITSALTLPTTEIGVSALSTVYMDTTWGGLGGTLVSEQVIGWDFKVATGAFPQHTAEGRPDLDFTKHQYNADEVQANLSLQLLLDPTTFAAQRAIALAGTAQAVQVKVAGSGGRLLKLNAMMRYSKPELFGFGVAEGQDTIAVTMVEAPDSTNFMQAILDHPSVSTLA